ncbi:MAG: hypothetical protein NTY31_02065 [Candidatus Falkowbacteria bacterium]|nr:hypothetical protein [Candidatus Falkowbacteria bacterium]
MFNDSNDPNNQNRQAVDDIFAETDKAQEGAAAAASTVSRSSGGAEIDTQKIGLAATDEFSAGAPEKRGQDKLFKIIIIVIVVLVVGLAGYLVYSKFLKAPPKTATTVPTDQKTEASLTATTSVPVEPSGSFVEVPPIPGVNAPAATTTTGIATSTIPTSLVDSDSDGLTDVEEKAAGTNINIIDTDNDGLSDYEEVKIYKTNPLSADTDGDGHLDGVEVKAGYNPNGPGKLSAATSTLGIPPVTR